MLKSFVAVLIHAALDVLKSNVPVALKNLSQLNCLQMILQKNLVINFYLNQVREAEGCMLLVS